MADKELEQHIKKLQKIDKVGDYTLYYDKEAASIGIYNGVDIHHAEILKLGKALFSEE